MRQKRNNPEGQSRHINIKAKKKTDGKGKNDSESADRQMNHSLADRCSSKIQDRQRSQTRQTAVIWFPGKPTQQKRRTNAQSRKKREMPFPFSFLNFNQILKSVSC